MRTRTLLALLAAITVSAPHAIAGTAAGISTPRTSLLTSDSLSRMSVGGAFQIQRRHITLGNSGETLLEVRHTFGHIACDLTEWFTLSGSAGVCEAQFAPDAPYSDEEFEWAVGAKFRLWDYNTTEPDFLAGRVSILLEGQYSEHESDYSGVGMEWDEGFAALVFRAELPARRLGDNCPYPHSLALFVGPVYSSLDGSSSAFTVSLGDIEERYDVGFVAGVDVYIARNLSVGWEMQAFNEFTHAFKLGYHF